MIRRETDIGWILITQHDHARLSGEIMTHWGNDRFMKPEPYDEVLFAVREHDSGWKQWDSEPKLNPETGYPANFTEMSFQDQADIWRRCYKPYSADNPYAASLVAMHFSKFNRNNLRKEPGNQIAECLAKELKDFVDEKLKLRASDGSLIEIPPDVINNLKLLQIGDIISLTLCHGWRSTEITEVPYNDNGSETALLIRSEDGFNYRVAPYPFDEPVLKFTLNGKNIDRKTFTDDKELRKTITSSEDINLNFTIIEG